MTNGTSHMQKLSLTKLVDNLRQKGGEQDAVEKETFSHIGLCSFNLLP